MLEHLMAALLGLERAALRARERDRRGEAYAFQRPTIEASVSA
jgi:hypothetical protein